MKDGASTGRPTDDCGVATRAALAETAVARLGRGLLSIAVRLEELCVGSPCNPLEELGRRVRAMLRSEEILDELGAGELPARVGLERFLLAQQLASPVSREIVASFSIDEMKPSDAASVAAAFGELVAMSDATVEDGLGDRLYVTSGWQGGDAVFAFAADGGYGRTPGAAGARAAVRAERLVRLAGGTLVRGEDRGRLVVGMLMPGGSGATGGMDA